MGNIKSFCCKDSASELDEQDDRARILPSNCDEFYNNNSIGSARSNEDNLSYGSANSNGNGSKSMEQSVLDKIYQKMAANVIDVAPGDSMVIQQAEFLERQKAYQAKLSQFRSPMPLKLGSQHQIPKHVSNSFDTKLPTSSPSSTSTNSTFLATGHNTTCPTFSSTGTHLSPNTITMMNSTNLNRLQEKRSVEYEPISADEVQLIKDISTKSAQAIKSLKINSNEQVVTVFRP